jgi:short-subunit dehydrogenase
VVEPECRENSYFRNPLQVNLAKGLCIFIINPYHQPMMLNNKTVLITGASSGIGCELAQQLGARGCRLVLIARRKALLEKVAGMLPTHALGHRVYPCDVADESAVKSACRKMIEERIEPDVLILNAGLSGGFSAREMDLEAIHYQFNVNFFGAVTFMKFLLPGMIERGTGLVAAMGSLAGYRGMPKSATYSASKAALANFIESMRIDLLHSGVKFVQISPGFVRTPMTDKNRFFMPFMISVERAVRIIIRGLEKEKPEIHFPYRMSLLAKVGRHLPYNVYAKMMQNRK